MDAFFASVEQRDEPAWRGRPLIVGGSPQSRGVVAACSYEARKFGINSAMPCSRAYRLCPEAVFVRPRFEAYREVSQQIHAIFQRFASLVEPLSLDEAYLDVTSCEAFEGSATLIASEIRREILHQTGLTASAGVSYNKFLAKTASDVEKPDGMFIVRPEQGEAFVSTLDIGKFFGIGKVTEAKMQSLGIYTGGDLRAQTLVFLQQHFGKSASWYYDIARGIDHRPVAPSRERKSIGAETTFATDMTDPELMLEKLEELAGRVVKTMQQKEIAARTMTLKVKYNDFTLVTRSQSLDGEFQDMAVLQKYLPQLLGRTEAGSRPVRLLGISVSAFSQPLQHQAVQLSLL